MSYAKLMWMFKEYNEMFSYDKKDKKKDGGTGTIDDFLKKNIK